jgi:hypothetical protein
MKSSVLNNAPNFSSGYESYSYLMTKKIKKNANDRRRIFKKYFQLFFFFCKTGLHVKINPLLFLEQFIFVI